MEGGGRTSVRVRDRRATPLTIGGTFAENRTIGGDYVVSLDTFDTHFSRQLDTIRVREASPQARIRARCRATSRRPRSGSGTSRCRTRPRSVSSRSGSSTSCWASSPRCCAMAILIALFGIVNTLGLSIFERQRELGLLRAVGMGRTQVKRMIRWESVIHRRNGRAARCRGRGGVRLRAPAGAGAPGCHGARDPGRSAGLFVVFAGLAGVLAAIWPARRAAKLNILASISYE